MEIQVASSAPPRRGEFQMEAKQPHVTPESKQALKELDESPASGWLASTVAAVAAGMSVVGEP